MSNDRTQKSPMEKLLNIFTEVKAGEGVSAILLFLGLFILLTAYYIMKTVREPLILASGGAEIKSYSSAGQALLLLLAVPVYAWLASRFPRRKLINSVTLFFVACLGLFYILAQLNTPFLGVIFFLWIGIFNLMVIAQFWSFANDIYTPETGKRIFVIVAFGASSGAVFGSYIAGRIPLDSFELLLLAGALLMVSLLLTNLVDSREKQESVDSPKQAKVIEEPIEKGDAFKLVFSNKYLLLIAFLMLFLNWVNTTGEYILSRTAKKAAVTATSTPEILAEAEMHAVQLLQEEEAAEVKKEEKGIPADSAVVIDAEMPIRETKLAEYANEYREETYEEAYIKKFYSDFYTIVNLLGVILQLFFVSRILKYLGVRIAIIVLPIIAMGGYFLIAFFPILSVVRWIKTAENSTDYSLQNTVRQVLFLPTTRAEKYKAKQAIDTFFVRAGDVLSAALVYAGVNWLAFETTQFALFNIVLVAVWLILAILIGIQNKKLTENTIKTK